MHTYRKRTILVLHSLLLVFFTISVFAYTQFNRQIPILNIGLSYEVDDTLILFLSFLCIVKVVHEIYKVEHHHEYERRIKKK